MEDGAICQVYDPKVDVKDAKLEFRLHDIEVEDLKFQMFPDPESAADGAHAIVVLTEWDEFAAYDYRRLYAKMQKPAFVFDGRNLLDHQKLGDIGFEVHAIGKARKYTTGAKKSYNVEEGNTQF
eukprot:g13357.t1